MFGIYHYMSTFIRNRKPRPTNKIILLLIFTYSLFSTEIRPRAITTSRASLASSTAANRLQDYKLAVLTFRCLHGQAPSYLTDSLLRTADVESRRHLRSAMTNSLVVPTTRCSTIGDRSFAAAAPRIWNSLPSRVTSSSSLTTFKRQLKTTFYLLFYTEDILSFVTEQLYMVVLRRYVTLIIFTVTIGLSRTISEINGRLQISPVYLTPTIRGSYWNFVTAVRLKN